MSLLKSFESLSSTLHRDAVSTPLAETVVPAHRDALSKYPYALPDWGLSWLQKRGVAVSGTAFTPHPHPVHKTWELYTLNTYWRYLATNRSTVMYMKQSKFDKLQQLNPNFITLFNQLHTPADQVRYDSNSKGPIDTPVAFMHDALMYIEPAQVMEIFQRSPNLQRMYASMVLPAECAFSLPSFNPKLYTFSVSNDMLRYKLEGNEDGSYNQPFKAIQWLYLHEITSSSGSLSVTLLTTNGPFHTLLISRAQARQEVREFYSPPCYALPNPQGISIPLRNRLVPKDVYEFLFGYVRAVRTLRNSDPHATIRTQRTKDEHSWVTNASWEYLADFAKQTAPLIPPFRFFIMNSEWERLYFWYSTNRWLFESVRSFTLGTAVATIFNWWDKNRICHLKLFGRNVFNNSLNPFTRAVRRLPKWVTGWSRFAVHSEARFEPKDLIKQSLPKFVTDRLPSCRPRWHLKPWVAAIAFGVGIGLAVWHATKEYNLQCRAKQYAAYMHPQRFQVKLITRSKHVVPMKFFLLPIREPQKEEFRPSEESGYSSNDSDYPNRVRQGRSGPTKRKSSNRLPPVEESAGDEGDTSSSDSESSDQENRRPPRNPEPAVEAENLEPPPSVGDPEEPQIPPPEAQPELNQILLALSNMIKSASERKAAFSKLMQQITPPGQGQAPLDDNDNQVFQPNPEVIPPDIPQPVIDSANLNHEAPNPTNSTLRPEAPAFAPEPRPSMQKVGVKKRIPLVEDPTAEGPVRRAKDYYRMPEFEGHWQMRKRKPNTPIPRMIDNNCLLVALAPQLGSSPESLWKVLCNQLPDSLVVGELEINEGLSTDHLELLCSLIGFKAHIESEYGSQTLGRGNTTVWLRHSPGHWEVSRNRPNIPEPPEKGPSWLMKFLKNNPEIPTRTVHEYTFNKTRAKNLSTNLKNGFDGIIRTLVNSPNYQSDTINHWPSMVEAAGGRSVEITFVLGFPGCGKSFPVQKGLRKLVAQDYTVVTPTAVLRDEWKAALRLNASESHRVSTWEMALLRPKSVIVIDEVFMLPNGYIDLLMALNPNLHSLILLGDPLQNDYHSTDPQSSNKRLMPEREYLKPFYEIYAGYTHRLSKKVSRLLGVPTTSEIEGSLSVSDHRKERAVSIVPSRIRANKMNENGIETFTASSTQGLTFNRVANIILDADWLHCSHNVALVASTRSRFGIHFVRMPISNKARSAMNQPVFEALMNGRPIDYIGMKQQDLAGCKILKSPHELMQLGEHRFANVRLVGGRPYDSFSSCQRRFHRMTEFKFDPYHPRSRVLEELPTKIPTDYMGDVMINHNVPELDPPVIPSIDTTHLPGTRRPLHYDIPCALPEPINATPVLECSAPPEPVYPGYNYEMMIPELTRPEAPEDLEIEHKGESSNQFPYIAEEYEMGAMTFKVLAPAHNSRKDPTLLPASIEKRLRFRKLDEPSLPSPDETLAADLLFHSYCDALHLDEFARIPFDPEAFVDCICENEYAQLQSKAKEVIKANYQRSDPDWRYTYVRIFAKTQHKVNECSIFGNWKACQTLALMHDYLVLVFGPVKKYQRLMLTRAKANPKVFVYAGKSPHDLSRFVQQEFPKSTERCWNDFTSFDQSQGVETTLFEAKKMRRVSIPEDLVNLHVYIKTHIECQFGKLTSMRLTGEPGTYDDNTDYNIAISNLRYNIRHIGGLFSGDDSAFPCRLVERSSWPNTATLFRKLQFKTETGIYATFCGYYVGHEGALRCPKPLLAKLLMAKDDGSLPDKLASYVAEFAVGHSLGDDLWRLLPLDQLPYQCSAFDFICRHAPREMKVALNIGSVPEDVISTWSYKLTRPLFAMLNRAQRIAYLKLRPSRFASWASSFFPSSQ